MRQPPSSASVPEGRPNHDGLEAREALARARAIADPERRLLTRAASILEAASRDWRRAPALVARALREAKSLPSPERRLLGEMVHGWIRFRRRLAWIVGSAALEPTLYIWLVLDAGGVDATLAEALRRAGLDADRAAHADDAIAQIADPRERIGVALSYPDWMVARVLDAYGAVDGEALLAAMNRRAPLAVRANRIKIDRDALAQKLVPLAIPARPTSLARDGLILDTHVNVYGLEPFRSGEMELQDEGSQLVAELVAPPPRGTVIDACAGAGGKTLALGAALENRGRVLALDVSDAKLAELRLRARRAGLTNVTARALPRGANEMPGLLSGLGAADRVLVDAPCSGLGVVRRNPETKWRVAPEEIAELAARQVALLARYAGLTRVGGRLIYATCSLLPEENEGVVEAFMRVHHNFEAVPVKEILGKERALAMGDGERLRVFPHRHDTDGFFAAVLRRRS